VASAGASPAPAAIAPLVRNTRRRPAGASDAAQRWHSSSARSAVSRAAPATSAPSSPARRSARTSTTTIGGASPCAIARDVGVALGAERFRQRVVAAEQRDARRLAVLRREIEPGPAELEQRVVAPAGARELRRVDGRMTSDSTARTGAPLSSTAATLIAPSPAGATRTRSFAAPVAASRTPRQANGSSAATSPAATPPCSAASSSAGCTPKRLACSAACSSSETSAKISSPARHTARAPWNTGPYAKPAAARRS
jgi:hypothetical protein